MGCIFCSDFDNPYHLCQTSNSDICSPCTQLKQLESQIFEAKRALDMLQQHRELRTHRNRVHDPIIHRVPPEIASSIFQFCMPAVLHDLGDRGRFTKKEVAMPLTLGAVCQHWRQIVWSTPRLWTVIIVRLKFRDLLGNLNILREWLGRSGQLPLSIQINAPVMAQGNELPSFTTMIEILNQYSNRWCILDLRLPSSLFSHLGGDRQAVSMLRTLRLRNLTTGGQFCLKKAKPEFVGLDGLSIKSVEIDWNNVTRAEIDGIQVDECLELLQRASQLKHLLLHTVSTSTQEHFPIPPNSVAHHQLRVLNFQSEDDSLDLFLSKVKLPGLQELACDSQHYGFLPTATIISLFQRSACRIRELTIISTDFEDDDDIIHILEAMPSLRYVELAPVPYADYSPVNLFKRLARTSIRNDDEDEENFLPELVSFVYCSCKEISWELVPGIFGPLPQLHNPRRRPLSAVHLNFYGDHSEDFRLDYIDRETIPRLLDVMEAGFNLEIDYRPDLDFMPVDLIMESINYHAIQVDRKHDTSSNSQSSSE